MALRTRCARLPRAHLKHTHSHTVRAAQLGYTPLLIASAKGHVEVARVLIEEGAPLDAKDMVRARPVRPALSHAHTHIVRVAEWVHAAALCFIPRLRRRGEASD